jgi:hypothetical protein
MSLRDILDAAYVMVTDRGTSEPTEAMDAELAKLSPPVIADERMLMPGKSKRRRPTRAPRVGTMTRARAERLAREAATEDAQLVKGE